MVSMRTQAEMLAAGVIAIGGGAFVRDASRSMSAHTSQVLVIARDASAAALTLVAVAVALLIARLVARQEGRHHQPPAPVPPRPEGIRRPSRPGEPAHGGYRLNSSQGQPPVMEDLPAGRKS